MHDISYQQQTVILKALAHPSRLAMVDALGSGERCVCELQRLVGSDISTVSKHLAVLKRAGIVADRRDGVQIYYRLRIPCILQVFPCVAAVMQADQLERACNSSSKEQTHET
jgi:DNA-binding transcriptional ArsR family regulator